MNLTAQFGQAVRQYREVLKISQEEFAHRAGLDRTYVSGIERGCRNPSLRTIERLATALGIGLDTLFQMVVEIGHTDKRGVK
jgi:transcriptional regulator with XRE-family HTH domain